MRGSSLTLRWYPRWKKVSLASFKNSLLNTMLQSLFGTSVATYKLTESPWGSFLKLQSSHFLFKTPYHRVTEMALRKATCQWAYWDSSSASKFGSFGPKFISIIEVKFCPTDPSFELFLHRLSNVARTWSRTPTSATWVESRSCCWPSTPRPGFSELPTSTWCGPSWPWSSSHHWSACSG